MMAHPPRRSCETGPRTPSEGAVKASVYHVQLNVVDAGASVPFYHGGDVLGMSNGTTDSGYHAVFFQDPDRLKLEVAYVP
jgi:hypothetical protein